MQEILQYIIKLSVALGAVYLFYWLVLRPITFYQWNRRYLVAYSIIALFIPFFNLYTYVPEQQLQQNQLVKLIPVINIDQQPIATSTRIDIWMIAGALILAGSLFLLAKLVIQWLSLLRIRRNATRIYHPEAKVYHVNENVIPFSFGDAIYVNTSLHSDQELHDIILHEFVHVRQKHSFDIIWSEILCILNWYNPFAWLIRHAIRQNLEFIADQAVLSNGLDKKTYQYHLLKVIGSPQYSIANNFNFSSLKKRIAMMNRLKSARVHLVKFLFVLPLMAVMLLAFRSNKGWYQEIKNDTIKKPDPASLARMKEALKGFHKLIPLDEFYQQNPSVREAAWSADQEIVVYLKDGTRQAYDCGSKEAMEKLAAKYGGLPAVFPLVPSVKPPAPPKPDNPPPPAAPDEPRPPKAVKAPADEVSIAEVVLPASSAPVAVSIQPVTDAVATEAVIETKATEPVIHLSGNVSANVAGKESTVLVADEIVVHGPVATSAKGTVQTQPVYYVDGIRSDIQDPKVLTKKFNISHTEIVNEPVLTQAKGEVKTATIINLVTAANERNVKVYISKESAKLVEEAKRTRVVSREQ